MTHADVSMMHVSMMHVSMIHVSLMYVRVSMMHVSMTHMSMMHVPMVYEGLVSCPACPPAAAAAPPIENVSKFRYGPTNQRTMRVGKLVENMYSKEGCHYLFCSLQPAQTHTES